MTVFGHLVSMPGFTYETARGMLEQFSTEGDSDDPREQKRKRIQQVATELVMERGYRKTSMADIARRAGVAKGTVYLYFKSKADLLVQIIVDEKKRYLKKSLPFFDESLPPRQRLREWLRMALLMPREMPLLSRLMSGDQEILLVMEEMDQAAQDQSRQVVSGLLGNLVGQAAGNHRWTAEELADRARALFAVAMVSGHFQDERVRRGLEHERLASILSDLLVNGVAGEPEGG